MIKKILSIVLVLIGLFFLLCFFALLPTIWGAVFSGFVMLGCFYLAYRLYPRKVKRDVVIPPPVKEEPVKTVEEVEVIPVIADSQSYSLNSKEFKDISKKAVDYSAKLGRYIHNYDSLNDEDEDRLSDLNYEIELEREKLPDDWDRKSIYLLNSCFLDMSHICDDLSYYIRDKDMSWIDDADYLMSEVSENFSELADIANGELDD